MGRSSCQQLTNDSIQKRKQVWSLLLPQETIYPRPVMNDIKVCLATNWWQLRLHWTTADQQSAWGSLLKGVGGRGGSLWLYSVWDNTPRTVLAALQQSTPTLEAGGNTLHSTGSPFLPDNRNWPYRYCNWPYRYCKVLYWYRNWLYQYTDYSMSFVVNRSDYQSLCNRQLSSSVLQVFFPKKPETIHFLRAMQSSSSFPLYKFLLQG